MYALQKTYCKVKDYTRNWIEISSSSMKLKDLYQKYSIIYLVLKEPFSDRLVGFNLDKIKPTYFTSNLTVSQFLIQQGNVTLSIDFPAKNFSKHYAKHADAFHAGYKISAINIAWNADAPLTREEKPDLRLTRPNTDYGLFNKHALINVNGFFHYVDANETGVYVLDGMKSCIQSNSNLCGILSFYDVCELKTIPITEELIYRRTPNTPLFKECLFKLNEDLSDKSIALVIGGYLHFLDQRIVTLVGTNVIRFNFNTIPLMERYYESKKFIDLSSLPIEKVEETGAISIASLRSDEVLTKYITLSQSFIVIFDNDEMFIETESLKQTPNRNSVVSVTPPIYPVVGGYGKIMNPWYRVEEELYSLNMKENHRTNFVVNSIPGKDVLVGSPIVAKPNGFQKSNNYYMKIGTINKRV